MTDKLRAAAQAAYKAMIAAELSDGSKREWEAAVDGLRAALAEPEQEPVACVGTNGDLMWLKKPEVIYSKPRPLYTAPPRREAQERMHPEIKKMYEDYFDKCFKESSAQQRPWVGLTDDEIWQEWSSPKDSAIDFARAIETKLKEKNGEHI